MGDSSSAPRIGDGVVTIDAEGMVRYVSPNANSALHRVGIMSNPVGTSLQELGFNDEPVRHAVERRLPVAALKLLFQLLLLLTALRSLGVVGAVPEAALPGLADGNAAIAGDCPKASWRLQARSWAWRATSPRTSRLG